MKNENIIPECEHSCNCGCNDLVFDRKAKDEYGKYDMFICPNCEGIILEYYELTPIRAIKRKSKKKNVAV